MTTKKWYQFGHFEPPPPPPPPPRRDPKDQVEKITKHIYIESAMGYGGILIASKDNNGFGVAMHWQGLRPIAGLRKPTFPEALNSLNSALEEYAINECTPLKKQQ